MTNEIKKAGDENDLLIKRAQFYCENKTTVHVKMNRRLHPGIEKYEWANGVIQEVNKEGIVLNENLRGRVPIFFCEILKIEPYIEESWKERKDLWKPRPKFMEEE